MSVNANEPGQQPEGQAPGNNTSGHPAWQEILEELPEAFHPLLTPKLEKWDKGVKDKLTEVQSRYDPYKPFVENNIDPVLLQQAVNLVNAIESDPEAVLKDLIDEFGLDYVAKAAVEQQQQSNDNDDEFFGDDQVDITKHPAFQQLTKSLEEVTGKLSKQEEQEQQAQATSAHEKALAALQEAHGEFDPMFVTALMSQGASGEEAVKQYQGIVNQAAAKIAGQQTQQVTQPPVVMGGDGTTGSGIPDSGANMSKMGKNDLNNMVAELIAKSQSE